jgi:hydrogenase maturation protease
MSAERKLCLILACGNSLRGDDGIGPWLAAWAEERFAGDSRVEVLSRQQWTPELAADIANAASVIFIDCSIESAPGQHLLQEVHAAASAEGFATHHQGAPQLMALAKDLYGTIPKTSLLFTMGAGATEMGEEFSPAVAAALPAARAQLELMILKAIEN